MQTRNKDNVEDMASIVDARANENMRAVMAMLLEDIVHDQRTPIATVYTIAQLLNKMLPVLLDIAEDAKALGSPKVFQLSEKEWRYLKDQVPIASLFKTVTTMQTYINGMLTELSNAQTANKQDGPLVLTSHKIRRIVEKMVMNFSFENTITVHKELQYDFQFNGNLILMMHVLLHLFKNAVEQIQLKRRGELFISTEEQENWNLLKIKDTGGGVLPENLPHLFTAPFTTKPQAAGMGLYFCKKTMERLGGEITCTSVYGDYTEFVLAFPKEYAQK